MKIICLYTISSCFGCIPVCACQYFSLSHKTLSKSSPSLTTTSWINWSCNYVILQMAELHISEKLLATSHSRLHVSDHTVIDITCMNSESFLKSSSRTCISFTAAFPGYQINYIFGITSQSTSYFVLTFHVMASKFSRNY